MSERNEPDGTPLSVSAPDGTPSSVREPDGTPLSVSAPGGTPSSVRESDGIPADVRESDGIPPDVREPDGTPSSVRESDGTPPDVREPDGTPPDVREPGDGAALSASGPDRARTSAPEPDGGTLLSVRDLNVRFRMRGGREIAAVTDVSFDLAPGECLALVGESGCGKSVLASALLGLLPGNARTSGSAVLREMREGGEGHGAHDSGSTGALDLLAADEATLARSVRGRRVGLVPQSPAAHLTPVRTVRSQLAETVRELTGLRGGELAAATAKAAERAAFPADHLDRYPHQLSGGLAQRAATALALVGDAPLLLADEPTTGLDRDLVDRTVDELRGHADDGRGLLIITHDLSAAARIADRVAVMYAGRVVELAEAEPFFGAPGPRHPYARGLLEALPERSFTPVPGMPPELGDLPDGCAFAPRCPRADAACAVVPAPADAGGVACHHPVDPAAAGAGPAKEREGSRT